MNSLVKYAEKVKDLEHRLELKKEKQDKEMRKDLEYKIDIQQETIAVQAKDIKKIKKEYDEIKRNEQKHSEEIKLLKESLSRKQPITPVVGFHVSLSKKVGGSGKVPFDKIFSNHGNGWNSITHTFRAATKGLYFFILTAMNSGTSAGSAWLMHGTSRISLAYAEGVHAYNVGTAAAVLLLDAGEHVYAQHEHGTLFSYSPNHYTYLAGFLIHETY